MTKQNIQLRILLLGGLLLLATALLVPSFVDDLPGFWKSYLPTQRLHLGLDLQGGTHLLLQVETEKAVETALDRYADKIAPALGAEAVVGATAKRDGAEIVVTTATSDSAKAKGVLEEQFPALRTQSSSARDGNTVLRLGFTQGEREAMRELAVEQSLETIRNRVDQFGVSEPIIQREGLEGVLIQLPGIQDPQRAKDLIGRTAMLELKLLPDNVNPAEYESGAKPLPEDWVLLDGIESQHDPIENRTTRERRKYVVEKKSLLTGDMITNAQPRPGSTGLDSPYVEWELNAEGAATFEAVTAANVGRQLAIILDKTVYSAPVIKDRIGGGRAVIEGDFTMDQARDLAIVLRAGALPAPVTIAEERTVGPSLGQDSINQGFLSFVVGSTLVLLFMLVYYKGAGLLADLAVLLNMVLLFGILALFQATLTLPGIAGIVLTMGMAVDANVLINERIREELRLGKTPKAAVEAGYERALPSILDSNITTFLAGVILFQFGTGPVKGFAVTLCVGILTTVFTAVYATRTVYDYRIANRRLQSVSV